MNSSIYTDYHRTPLLKALKGLFSEYASPTTGVSKDGELLKEIEQILNAAPPETALHKLSWWKKLMKAVLPGKPVVPSPNKGDDHNAGPGPGTRQPFTGPVAPITLPAPPASVPPPTLGGSGGPGGTSPALIEPFIETGLLRDHSGGH